MDSSQNTKCKSDASAPITKRESEQDFMSRILADVTPLNQFSTKERTNWMERGHNLVVDFIHDPQGLLHGTQHEIKEALQELVPTKRVTEVTSNVSVWLERLMNDPTYNWNQSRRQRWRRSKPSQGAQQSSSKSLNGESDGNDYGSYSGTDTDSEYNSSIEEEEEDAKTTEEKENNDVTDYCMDGLQAALVASEGKRRPPHVVNKESGGSHWTMVENAISKLSTLKMSAFPSSDSIAWMGSAQLTQPPSPNEVEEKFKHWWDQLFHTESLSYPIDSNPSVGVSGSFDLGFGSNPKASIPTSESSNSGAFDPSLTSNLRSRTIGSDLGNTYVPSDLDLGSVDLPTRQSTDDNSSVVGVVCDVMEVVDIQCEIAEVVQRQQSGLKAEASGGVNSRPEGSRLERLDAEVNKRLREKLKKSSSQGGSRGSHRPGVRSWWREEMISLGRIQHIVRQLLGTKIIGTGLETAATFDPLAALIVWREQKQRSRCKKEGDRQLNPHSLPEPVPPLQPLRRALQHACAAYGTFGEMHLTRVRDLNRQHIQRALHRMVEPSAAGELDTQAAARLAGISEEDILDAQWSNMAFSPCCYLAVDHTEQWVVLSVRGTACAGDTLTDCCAEVVPFLSGHAHAGILAAAWQLVPAFFPRLAATLLAYPNYRPVMTGHSMGAGVAALLAMLLHSPDIDVRAAIRRGVCDEESIGGVTPSNADIERDMEVVLASLAKTRCVSIAAPCVCTLGLSLASVSYITSIVAGKDVICRLSITNVQNLVARLKSATPLQPVLRAVSQALKAANAAYEEFGMDVEEEEDEEEEEELRKGCAGAGSLVNRGEAHRIGILDKEADSSTLSTSTGCTSSRYTPLNPSKLANEELQAWSIDDDLGTELRNLNRNDFLCLPGRVLHMRHLTSKKPTIEVRHTTAFSEIPLSTRMMSDHMPIAYVNTLDRIQSSCDDYRKHT
eukprot:CAMPEP_0196574638 /NCGR_PEP_ID=MMETSP1081-20130531/4317_1 /TAXON_ID=36882 /ORGANISM="Pyramimonas amylifera, Strain CCMP720" /LENGTH=950 /DNA_ID=CAMNT_0041892729 /DNA_START=248 /DNA_END=3100 /DNA_ORIENTATION=+